VIPGDLLTVAAVVAAGLGGYLIGRAGRRPGEVHDSAGGLQTGHPAETRFEQLIREIGVGIVSVDGRGRIEAINPVATAIFEMPAQRVLGRTMIEAVPSFELDRRVREALGGRASRGQIPINVRQTSRMLTVTVVPAEGTEGALVIAIDETRLHELEQTRRDFVAGVSHELRTPLSSINLMIETILSTGNDEEALEMFLPRVKQEVDRMIHLVEDLLDLARSEAGRLRLRTEELDLSAVAGNILKTFEPRAAQLGVKLELDATPARLEGDADRLAQVMVNLVDNAMRHTPAGGTIAVEVRRIEGAASLTVRDTGVGIPFRRFAARLRTFLRGRPLARTRLRRNGPGLVDREADRRSARRHGRRRLGTRLRRDLHLRLSGRSLEPDRANLRESPMPRPVLSALAFGTILLIPPAVRADVTTLTAAGSTALLPLLAASAELYQSRHPATTITVSGGGSHQGIAQVAAGNADLGMSDTPASGYPNLVDHRVCIVGYSVLANPAAGVTNLSKRQLQDIFAGKVANWSEVGGADLKSSRSVGRAAPARGWSSRKRSWARCPCSSRRRPRIRPPRCSPTSAPRPARSRTRPSPASRSTSTTTSPASTACANWPSTGRQPTEEDIGAGRYPLWSYEHVYTNGPPSREISRFLALVESNAETIHALGFIPMRAQFR
jgi:PAS domain S-box-containing protein